MRQLIREILSAGDRVNRTALCARLIAEDGAWRARGCV